MEARSDDAKARWSIVFLLALCAMASCADPPPPPTPVPPPTPTADVQTLNDRQVLSLVADRFRSKSLGMGLTRNAKAEYQGAGRWVVQWSTAQWEVFEKDKSVFPMNQTARARESVSD